MTEKPKTDKLFNFAPNSYLERTARPVYGIVFLLPFIIFYEVGTLLINTDLLNRSQVRVVAFVWLQNALEYLGFGSKFAWAAPPLAAMLILAAWQLASRKSWRFNKHDFGPMICECILLAVPLIVLSLFLNSPRPVENYHLQSQTAPALLNPEAPIAILAVADDEHDSAVQTTKTSVLANIITGIGAGIYEELVFRLVLICALMIVFQDFLRFEQRTSIILSVLISAALFSAHHHIVFVDGQLAINAPFNWTEFLFRTIAGVYFAALFAIRGFAITAGTHALYDTIAVIINAAFFGP